MRRSVLACGLLVSLLVCAVTQVQGSADISLVRRVKEMFKEPAGSALFAAETTRILPSQKHLLHNQLEHEAPRLLSDLVDDSHLQSIHAEASSTTGEQHPTTQAVLSGPITIETGVVQGLSTSTGYSWLGIPYAAPPTGDNRFRAPQSAQSWSGVLNTKTMPNSCSQSTTVYGATSEDCLYLNIFAPAAAATSTLPVMVFIHGGSFTSGGINHYLYDGSALAARAQVIVVTINYRLGAIGFLASDALAAESTTGKSGNFGFLDQQMALSWVKRNIAKFGGNPSSVTLFGQNAGAVSICLHLVSPGSAGRFQRAILESGSCLQGTVGGGADRYSYARQNNEFSSTFLSALSCQDAACLRSVRASYIVGVQSVFSEVLAPWHPVIDGYIIPDQPVLLIRAGIYNNVPILSGTNTDDGAFFASNGVVDDAGYRSYLSYAFGTSADAVYTQYNPSVYANLASQQNVSPYLLAQAQLFNDHLFLCPNRRLSNLVSGVSRYTYRFDRALSWIQCSNGNFWCSAPSGVYHGSELFFVFGVPQQVSSGSGVANPTFNSADTTLVQVIQDLWGSFALRGIPSSSLITRLSTWLAYTSTSPNSEILTSPVQRETAYKSAVCNFWDGITAELTAALPASHSSTSAATVGGAAAGITIGAIAIAVLVGLFIRRRNRAQGVENAEAEVPLRRPSASVSTRTAIIEKKQMEHVADFYQNLQAERTGLPSSSSEYPAAVLEDTEAV